MNNKRLALIIYVMAILAFTVLPTRAFAGPNIVGDSECDDCGAYSIGAANGLDLAAIPSSAYSNSGITAFTNPAIYVLITPTNSSNIGVFMYVPTTGTWVCIMVSNHTGLSPTQAKSYVKSADFVNKVKDAQAAAKSGVASSGGGDGSAAGGGSSSLGGYNPGLAGVTVRNGDLPVIPKVTVGQPMQQ